MSGIYPSGAVPSYRSSNQTVVVHHWDPKWDRMEILRDAYPLTSEVADESVIPYNAECSVPLTVVVRETNGTRFVAEEIPNECPLCHRLFNVFDRKRIQNAAISQHLRMSDWADPTVVYPTDLILDV